VAQAAGADGSTGTQHLLGPMAITIMGGLLVTTLLTLSVVPALYSPWFRVRADDSGDIPSNVHD
jgi:multidrug efflux pump subunit AcrB